MVKKVVMISTLIVGIFFFRGLVNNQQNDYRNKISFEGFQVSKSFSLKELSQELIDETAIGVNIKFDYDFSSNLPIPSFDASEAEIEAYRAQLFQEGRNFHSTRNEEYMRKLGLNGHEEKYVSEYSPYIEVILDKQILEQNNFTQLIEYAKSDLVEMLYIQEVTPAMNEHICIAVNHINGSKTIKRPSNPNGKTGKGIKIGIADTGIIDDRHSDFSNISTTVRKVWYYNETVTEHATTMARIAGGADGIASEASIHSVEISGSPTGELDWLVGQKVNVINASYGIGAANGKYSSHSANYDYYVEKYKFTVVAAVGNNGGLVSNPALGKNVISVGARGDDDLVENYSSYQSNPTGQPIPTICSTPDAMFLDSPYDASGTSVSAASVTGSIAIMMESNAGLRIYPEAVKAILMATADKPNDRYPKLESGHSLQAGAGFLNLDVAMNYSSDIYYRVTKTDKNGKIDPTEYYSCYITPTSSARFVISYLTTTPTVMPTIQLELYRYGFTTPISSVTKTLRNTNTALLEYSTNITDIYQCKIKDMGNKLSPNTIIIMFCYRIEK